MTLFELANVSREGAETATINAFRLITHPLTWFAVVTWSEMLDSLGRMACFVIFAAAYGAHLLLNWAARRRHVRDLGAGDDAVYVYQLEFGADVDPVTGDSDLNDATDEVEKWLRDQEKEVWKREGNVIICEDGYYVAARASDAPTTDGPALKANKL